MMPTLAPESVSLLRLATAGSVDDGKSTLVGRLLHDSRSVMADQLESVSGRAGHAEPDLALLTDGLRAEREQGITIDVAYRYFATQRRRFILADTPGHVQYTRNMVTGTSTAEAVVVLVDARNGVTEQTRRHAAVAALLRVPHVVLALNKMDLVEWKEEVFAEITADFTRCAKSLGLPEVNAIPLSALNGDNVVEPSPNMDWYGGPTLLEYLERAPAGTEALDGPARMPVQYVIRPQRGDFRDYRGYAGQITSGVLRVGDAVSVLPSGRTTYVAGIDALGTEVTAAWAPQSVTVRLTDDVDVTRGDLLAAADRTPQPCSEIAATVCHLDERPLRRGDRVQFGHASRTVNAIVQHIPHRLDIETLERTANPGDLVANDIGRIVVRTTGTVSMDPYVEFPHTGSFLLIDPVDGATLTAGMVEETR